MRTELTIRRVIPEGRYMYRSQVHESAKLGGLVLGLQADYRFSSDLELETNEGYHFLARRYVERKPLFSGLEGYITISGALVEAARLVGKIMLIDIPDVGGNRIEIWSKEVYESWLEYYRRFKLEKDLKETVLVL